MAITLKKPAISSKKPVLYQKKITLHLEGTLDLKLSPCSLVTEEKKIHHSLKMFSILSSAALEKWFKIA